MNQLIKHPYYKHLKWYLIFLLIPFIGSCTPAMRATYSMIKGESAQFDAKNINEALEYYERAILEDPNHARAYARAGWLWYESKKDSDKAIDYFGKALSINDSLGKDKFLYIYKGLWGAYYRKNNWRETVNNGKKALEVNPNEKDTPHVLNGIGYSLMNLGDFQSALKYFQQAINKNKDYKYPYGNLAFYYLNTGNPKKGLEILNQALMISPDDSILLNARAWYYVLTGEPEKALEDCKKLIQAGPADVEKNFSNVFHIRGRIYLESGEFNKAIEDLKASGEKKIFIYIDRGLAHLRSGSYEKATDDYNAARKLPNPWRLSFEGKQYINRLSLLGKELNEIKTITEKIITD